MELNGTTYFERKIMTIHVVLEPEGIHELVGKAGRVLMLPFRGTVEGELFNGIVLPGGCDTQVENLAGVRHMSARYMMEGTDCSGQKGRIYIENNGWYTDGNNPVPFVTVPTFYTDCEALADFLHTNQFITKGFPGEAGPDICVYQLIPQSKGTQST